MKDLAEIEAFPDGTRLPYLGIFTLTSFHYLHGSFATMEEAKAFLRECFRNYPKAASAKIMEKSHKGKAVQVYPEIPDIRYCEVCAIQKARMINEFNTRICLECSEKMDACAEVGVAFFGGELE